MSGSRVAEGSHAIDVVSLDHVQIAAPPGCEAAGRRFFGELIGLVELPRPEALSKRGGLWFRLGAQQLHVGVEVDFRAAKKAHVALRLRDAAALTALFDRLVAAGVPAQMDHKIEGAARFFTEDPWGNRLEIVA